MPPKKSTSTRSKTSKKEAAVQEEPEKVVEEVEEVEEVKEVEEVEDVDSEEDHDNHDDLGDIRRGQYIEDHHTRREKKRFESVTDFDRSEKKRFESVTDFDRSKAQELEQKKVKDLGINDLIKVLIIRGEDIDNPNITLRNNAKNLMKMLNGERIPRKKGNPKNRTKKAQADF